MTEDQIRRILWRCIWMSRGSAPVDRDYAYWIPLWPALVARGVEIHIPDYGERRVLGWQAEGEDTAAFGDYANPPSPYHDVPPYPGDVAPPVEPPPVPGQPPAIDAISQRLDEMNAQQEARHQIVMLALQRLLGREYVGEASIKYFGTAPIALRPK